MHHVFRHLVVNVEVPVFDREPKISGRLSPFYAQSIVARCRQKIKPLQTHPEVRRVTGTKAVLVINPRQVPVESACHVAMHEHHPVENGNHWNGSLSGNRQGNRLVLRLVICGQSTEVCALRCDRAIQVTFRKQRIYLGVQFANTTFPKQDS